MELVKTFPQNIECFGSIKTVIQDLQREKNAFKTKQKNKMALLFHFDNILIHTIVFLNLFPLGIKITIKRCNLENMI